MCKAVKVSRELPLRQIGMRQRGWAILGVVFVTALVAAAPRVHAETVAPERLIVPGQGIGGVRVGMLMKDAMQLLGPATPAHNTRLESALRPLFGDPPDSWGYTKWNWSWATWKDIEVLTSNPSVGILFGTVQVAQLSDETVMAVVTDNPIYRTAEGFGVGSSIQVVDTVRGRVLMYAPSDSSMPTIFKMDGMQVFYDESHTVTRPITRIAIFCTDRSRWYCAKNQPQN